MYITVRYGSDQKVIFNPICKVANLLSDIKSRCNIRDADGGLDSLDLCDETGTYSALLIRLKSCSLVHMAPGPTSDNTKF